MNAVTDESIAKAVSDKDRGLYGKFHVERTDGSTDPGGKHEHDEFFVLNMTTDKHAIPAIKAYANSCETEYPHLAADLRAKLRERMPSPFVTIPETMLPDGTVVPEFRMARYLATIIDGKAEVFPDEVPTVEISYYDAKSACEAAGRKQITETQHAALRQLLLSDGRNWKSGVVGEGDLRQGLHKGSVDGPVSNDYEPEDPDEDRRFYLPNGEIILDAAGNLDAWVSDDVQGNEEGIVAKPFAASSISIQAPFPSMTHGVGFYPDAGRDWSGSALIRGGFWRDEGVAGLCGLHRWRPRSERGSVGVRCTE